MIYNVNMLSTDETKWCSYGPCRVMKIWGYNPQGSGTVRYIQFHAKPAAAITNGDVPAVAALLTTGEQWFDWFFECPVELTELSIAISSTQDTYTAITDTGVNLTAEIDTSYFVDSHISLVGDLTTGVANRQIWTNAQGPRQLLRLDISNAGGATIYPNIRASDSALSGDTTVKRLAPIQSGDTTAFFFGLPNSGFSPYRKDADGTVHDGCTVAYNLTGAYSEANAAGTDLNIRAVVYA